MDKRSWPWKKKTSEKTVNAADSANALSSSTGNQTDQDDTKSANYIRISVESYAHLTELEDQVKILNERLSSVHSEMITTQSEMITKDNLVKQHAKVAEEAVSGWEKAEAEALALKQQLESVTLLKLTAENRASRLDDALKECMKQIRSVKEEGEQKLHDVVVAKTKQWEKVKAELEAKIVDFEQELLRASGENAALSRSLQERSNMLMKISNEKSQADADIEVLKSDIQACEREISSLKYELHVISKELEIRNEEKNMSLRSAEVANRQHLEDVKKITKLEAECQRLRGLVRKKLPGPAALAQMKLEVDNLGRDYGETRLRRSPAKSSSPHHASVSEFTLENMQQCHKENEFLTARLLGMEEETKMLKEALSKRNSELQASRNMCAKTASKLHSIETHIFSLNQKSPSVSITDIPFEIESNPPSLTSMSEDGIDEQGSCSESWATVKLMSESSQFKKENGTGKSHKADNSNNLDLMDDFLEMEKLACLSTEANGDIPTSHASMDKQKTDDVGLASLVDIQKDKGGQEGKAAFNQSSNLMSLELTSNKNYSPTSKLQSRILSIFESQSQHVDMGKILEEIKRIVKDAQEELPRSSVGCVLADTHSINAACADKECNADPQETVESEITVMHNDSVDNHIEAVDQQLKNAISHIHDFVISLSNAALQIQGGLTDDHGLSERIQEFSVCVHKVLCNEVSLNNFILCLSYILSEASIRRSVMFKDKDNEGENNSSDCVDKVTLLENKVTQHEPGKGLFSGVHTLSSHSSSDPEIEGPISHGFDLKTTMEKCSLEEFEQLKLEKENMGIELARCNDMLEQTKLQLVETQQHLLEINSQLADSQKSNSLVETQLKCMAESYKSLEARKEELETEINLLCTKAEALADELKEEKHNHEDDLAKYNELQQQIERIGKCSICSTSEADVDIRTKQEKDLAAAAEKLAECQETIFLLGRQLNALRPPAESLSSSPITRPQIGNDMLDEKPTASGSTESTCMLSPQHNDQAEIDNVSANVISKTGGESPLNGYNSYMSPSDTEASPFPRSPLNSKHQKQKSSRSSTSSSLSSEKHGRGFSRFFSKGKSDQ